MRKKKILLPLLLCGLLVSACSAPAVEETPTRQPTAVPTMQAERREFVLPCYQEGSFHPITGTNQLNLLLAPLIYQGLFCVDETFTAQNQLCESYTVSEDGLTWHFQLADATFSDGSPLTGKEVADSLRTAQKTQRYEGRLKNLKTVEAEGNTVVVTLEEPNGTLPLLLDIPIVKEGGDSLRPYGTGDYVIAENEKGIYLAARQGADVPVQSIPLRTIETGDDLSYAFDAQEVSLVDTDLTGTNTFGYSGQLETMDYSTSTLLYIGCNLRSGICREQKVRQAVALAVDRDGIVKEILSGHGEATSLLLHPNVQGYDIALAEQWNRDLERAEELLIQAGWTRSEEGVLSYRGEQRHLRLIVNQDNIFKIAVAENISATLQGLGMEVELEKLSWEEFLSALEKGEFDLFVGETTLTADFDLEALLGKEGTLNYMGFTDEAIWSLMKQCRTKQADERVATLVNLCGRMAEEAPVIPICFKNRSLLTQWGQVSGVEPVQQNVFYHFENWTISQY